MFFCPVGGTSLDIQNVLPAQDRRHVAQHPSDEADRQRGTGHAGALPCGCSAQHWRGYRGCSVTLARRPAMGSLARLLATALVFSACAVLPMALAAGVAGLFGNFPFSWDSTTTAQSVAQAALSSCSAPANTGRHPSAREHATQVACSGNTGATAPVRSVHLTAPSRPEGR